MSLDTTREQFRNKHFRTIHKIIVERFAFSIQNEDTFISDFADQQHNIIDFEYSLDKTFNQKFYLLPTQKISDILDQICQA